MMERLEHFGNACYLPGPKIVGTCQVCGGEMYDYELCHCDTCGNEIHSGCRAVCEQCGHDGCKDCMVNDPELGAWFCGSECKEDYRVSITQLRRPNECQPRLASLGAAAKYRPSKGCKELTE